MPHKSPSREAFQTTVDRLKNGRVTEKEAQTILNALASWVDKRFPGDEWDEVVSLERSLFGPRSH